MAWTSPPWPPTSTGCGRACPCPRGRGRSLTFLSHQCRAARRRPLVRLETRTKFPSRRGGRQHADPHRPDPNGPLCCQSIDQRERGWGRVENITSQSVKATDPCNWACRTGARTGLTGYVAGTRAAGGGPWRVHQQFSSPCPAPMHGSGNRARKGCGKGAERIDGRLPQKRSACRPSASRAATRLRSRNSARTCAFLCSQHAGFIVGQNILLDGAARPKRDDLIRAAGQTSCKGPGQGLCKALDANRPCKGVGRSLPRICAPVT